MAVITIPWGDGSGDNIYLSYSASQGDQNVLVSSDANAGSTDRTKTITFTASHHGTTDTKTLTVVQEGVPEQYIVFVDPVVEQICATNWGDGVGLKPSQAAQVKSIGTVFRGNTNIVSFDELVYFGLTTGTNINTLNSAFYGCSNLESVSLPPIGYIGANAFRDCSSLQCLKISSSFSSTSTGAFVGTTSLTRVDVPDMETWLGCVFTYNASNYGQHPFSVSQNGHLYIDGIEVVDVVIPNTITSLNPNAFSYCNGIETISIPSSVTSIGDNCFFKCNSLKSVTIPSTVSSLGGKAFNTCTGLLNITVGASSIGANCFQYSTNIETITLLEGVTHIYTSCFNGLTKPTELILPSTLTTIDSAAFANMRGLRTMVSRPTTPPTITGAQVFANVNSVKIYVPYSSEHSILNNYKAAQYWSDKASSIYELNPDGTIPT